MHRTMIAKQHSFAEPTNPTNPSIKSRVRFSGRRKILCGLLLGMMVSLFGSPVARAQPMPPQGTAPVEAVILQLNRVIYRKMSNKKRIARVSNADNNVVDISAIDPTTIALQGVGLGRSTVTLTDEDGGTETFRVLVTAYDIRELKDTLKKAVRSGNIEPIPAGNNAIILTGTVDRAEDLTAAVQTAQAVVGQVQVINNLRMGGVQQVQLDVIVARVNRSKIRDMAFNFLTSGGSSFFASTVGSSVGTPLGPIGVGSNVLSSNGLVTGTPGGLSNIVGGVLVPGNGFLYFLRALKTEGLAKIVAKPRLVTQSGRLASFLDGGEQAVPVPAGLGQIGVQFEEFGTRLNFVPLVLGNGRIHLEVEPEVSSLDPASGVNIQGVTVPGRLTQRVRTTVEMEPGQTFAIGGLIQRTVTAGTVKTPIVGELPFVGALFSSKIFNEQETELVILVTPYLVDPMDCSQLPKYLPGQDTRSPDDFELFLEGILEAPRGQREVFPDRRHYVPAYKNGPTSGMFPCGVTNYRGPGLLGRHGQCSGCTTGCNSCSPGVIVSPVHTETSTVATPLPHGAVSQPKRVIIREAPQQKAPGAKISAPTPKAGSAGEGGSLPPPLPEAPPGVSLVPQQ